MLEWSRMLPQVNNTIQLGWNLYLTDFLDIAIISVLIYSLIVFFRKTKNSMLFAGLAVAGVLYVVAELFNLYLTLITLRYFVGVSVIIFVILFQNELKRYLELLGLIGTRKIKSGVLNTASPFVDDIIQSCVQMAQDKTGALIVLEGNRNLDSLIEGGVSLDGVISEELLLSIFDHHSDGHDGAVIVRNNRIFKFGTHLPLSTNFKALGKHGLRHSAALGLSEVSDALCIVVSEERKQISVCYNGKIKKLEKFDQLEKELEKFINEKFVAPKEKGLKKIFKYNTTYKLVSILLASCIWFLTAYQADMLEKSYSIPITFSQVPPEVLIEDISPSEVFITVSGRGEKAFEGINNESFQVIFEDNTLETGVNTKILSEKNFVVPRDLALVSFEPESFLFTATQYLAVEVSVSPKITGNLYEGLELKNVVVTPDMVSLWVPQGVSPPERIYTTEINIETLHETKIIPVRLVLPEGVRLARGDETAHVAIIVGDKTQ